MTRSSQSSTPPPPPPYSILLKLAEKGEDESFADRYIAFMRDHMIYATYDEKAQAGELLFAGEEGQRLMDHFITADNAAWQIISGAANRMLKPFLDAAGASPSSRSN